MTLYKCLKCGRVIKSIEELRDERTKEIVVKCPGCYGRILFKVRPQVVKRVRAI